MVQVVSVLNKVMLEDPAKVVAMFDDPTQRRNFPGEPIF